MSEPHVLHLPEKYAAQVRALLQAHIPEAQVWAYGHPITHKSPMRSNKRFSIT